VWASPLWPRIFVNHFNWTHAEEVHQEIVNFLAGQKQAVAQSAGQQGAAAIADRRSFNWGVADPVFGAINRERPLE
jgi:hypothetical protein